MTTPSERAVSLLRAYDLLLSLTALEKPVDVAVLRSKAVSALRHYPDKGMIKAIAAESEWLQMEDAAEDFPATLTRRVSLPPLPSSAPDDSRVNENFFEDFRQREIESLRAKVRTGELLSIDDFRRRLRASSEALRHLIVEGSVFAIDVDGLCYFPSLLLDGRYDRERLFSICRIIWPAHPTVRLHYLTSKRGNLGGLTPLECLADNKKYRMLKSLARGETIDSYRTSITAYSGLHDIKPSDVSPSYAVAEDVDPRCGFWKRALRTLRQHGFTGVCPPYEQVNEGTVFISQLKAGSTTPVEGARLTLSIDAKYANVNVERFVRTKKQYLRVPLEGKENIEEMIRTIFRELWNRGAC